MARRIMSARDQVDMLSPWRIAAPDPNRTMGININDTVQDYTGQILNGDKVIETRNSRSLHPYVGRQVGIVRTHKSRNQPTTLVGYATVGEPRFYGSPEEFDADYHLHQVGPDSPHHISNSPTGTKWGYPMHEVHQVEPTPVHARGNVAREVPPLHTAGPKRRFNQEWQVIGGDYVPLDVISHYMQRKETGFGDEKSEYNNDTPLSQQITERGYEKPVELITDGKSGSVYDGHHRIDIARQLGHTHVPVQVTWRVPDPVWGPGGAYGNEIEPWLKGWLTDMRKGRETVGRRLGVLSDEDRVSVAEQVMERSGLDGKYFYIPQATKEQARNLGRFDHYGEPDVRGLQREHSSDAEDFVNGILRERGWDDDPNIRVKPNHWDLREPGSGQAMTDGMNYIGLAREHTNAMTLLHETAHILTKTPHRPGGHGLNFQKVLHGLYHEHLGPEAADTFAGIAFPDRHNTRLAIQQPPSGLTFRHWKNNDEIADHFGKFDMPIMAPAVTAYLGDEMVGSLEWHPHYDSNPERKGEVSLINVPRKHRRKGIATAMYDWAKGNAEPAIHHSPLQSYDGEAWAAAEEDRQPSEI